MKGNKLNDHNERPVIIQNGWYCKETDGSFPSSYNGVEEDKISTSNQNKMLQNMAAKKKIFFFFKYLF